MKMNQEQQRQLLNELKTLAASYQNDQRLQEVIRIFKESGLYFALFSQQGLEVELTLEVFKYYAWLHSAGKIRAQETFFNCELRLLDLGSLRIAPFYSGSGRY